MTVTLSKRTLRSMQSKSVRASTTGSRAYKVGSAIVTLDNDVLSNTAHTHQTICTSALSHTTISQRSSEIMATKLVVVTRPQPSRHSCLSLSSSSPKVSLPVCVCVCVCVCVVRWQRALCGCISPYSFLSNGVHCEYCAMRHLAKISRNCRIVIFDLTWHGSASAPSSP